MINWPGIAYRLIFAVVAVAALFGWVLLGWEHLVGVATGFILAVIVSTGQEIRRSGYDIFAWKIEREDAP